MYKIVSYSMKEQAAFVRNVEYIAWSKLPKLLFSFLVLLVTSYLLSRTGISQPGLTISAISSREALTMPLAMDENYRQGGEFIRQASDSGDNVLFAKAEGPFTLGNSALRIPLTPVNSTTPEEGLLTSRLDTLKRGRNIYLVIRDLHTEVQPGILYHLYLDLPVDAKPLRDDPHFIGFLNFFNSAYGNSASDQFFSYDITSVARKLYARKLLGKRTTLTVYPASSAVTASAPKIGRVELLEQ
ncbi:MAG: hypothetical protein ACJ741_14160 [Pyrinomonadaceae bacterium]